MLTRVDLDGVRVDGAEAGLKLLQAAVGVLALLLVLDVADGLAQAGCGFGHRCVGLVGLVLGSRLLVLALGSCLGGVLAQCGDDGALVGVVRHRRVPDDGHGDGVDVGCDEAPRRAVDFALDDEALEAVRVEVALEVILGAGPMLAAPVLDEGGRRVVVVPVLAVPTVVHGVRRFGATTFVFGVIEAGRTTAWT